MKNVACSCGRVWFVVQKPSDVIYTRKVECVCTRKILSWTGHYICELRGVGHTLPVSQKSSSE